MIKKKAMKAVREMMPDITRTVKKECQRLIKSGGIDIKPYEGLETALAKVILTVALENIAKQYYPAKWNKSYMKDREHLRFF